MKKIILALVLLSLASDRTAHGQAGAIVLAGDPQGIDCSLSDKTAGMCSYYVVHVGTSGAKACQFSARAPSCFTGTWLSDTVIFPVTVGDSQSGISIGYGECTPGPIHVLTINFFCQGMSSSCCYYSIKPDPNAESGTVDVVDCSNNLLAAKVGQGIINPTDDCPCGELSRDSTWGRVKATYQ